MLEKVEGIVLRTQDYGETHKIVTLYTKEKGKIGGIARGAKKPKSRMAAVTQPFIHGLFLYQTGANLGTLQQGEVLSPLRKIREDIIKTGFASYIAELTDKLVDEKQPDSFLFNQLLKTLEWIAEGKDAEVLTIIYELKIYKKAGIAPILDQCAVCRQKENAYFFSVAEGGLICSSCKWKDGQAIELNEKLSRLLYLFLEIDVERIGNISIKEENKELLKQIMELYYNQYGGFFLKTKKFLKQIDLFK
ncbi:DNA repair protein RecO [Aquibacillus salsiterrae]|uniref:DNA repair protein RecO n=1 Tax=Aquibacillus salsiterrae TaxID=2950439 RepID=A0A9X3WC29_9BACI|nr:DNA repair protein RecO [Aquibacillus salsiterrae]MDC3415551.1 DNA repair protein RecO [Aquibacillus salsiterrae]